MDMRDEVRQSVGAGWRFDRISLPDGRGYIRVGLWHPQAGTPPPARGTALLLTGRCECLEKYAEQAAEWAARGFRVAGLDWRGQGGSSRFLPDRQKGHVPDFDLFLDDLDLALPILHPAGTPGPVIAFGHSMGGHVLARFAAERPHPFQALILASPMFGISLGPMPEALARRLVAHMVHRGRAEDYAPGQCAWPAEPAPFRGNRLSSDPVRYRALHEIYGSDPSLALGGVTWGWLDAAYRSIDRLLRRTELEGLDLPILILSGDKDRVVPPARHRAAASRLPRAWLCRYPARHELLMETDPIRHRVWSDMDRFLDAIAPPVRRTAAPPE